MARDWDVTFASWGAAPSATETQKCERAELAVRKAIDASAKLNTKQIEVFTQGSYKNGTNVRQDSDVDVCVLYTGEWFPNYQFSTGLNRESLGNVAGSYPYAEFKQDVGKAVFDYFERQNVTPGQKAFDIHANTYRIDADVVPCFEHRRYTGTISDFSYVSGTQLMPASGPPIVNWPKQNYANGVAKNTRTGGNFKTVTRVLKKLRYDMIDEGDTVAGKIPSYLVECLAWNIPDATLQTGSFLTQYVTLKEIVRRSIIFLWDATKDDTACSEWGEVNELKYLFRSTQPWTRVDVHTFLQNAWNHIGFE